MSNLLCNLLLFTWDLSAKYGRMQPIRLSRTDAIWQTVELQGIGSQNIASLCLCFAEVIVHDVLANHTVQCMVKRNSLIKVPILIVSYFSFDKYWHIHIHACLMKGFNLLFRSSYIRDECDLRLQKQPPRLDLASMARFIFRSILYWHWFTNPC